MGADDLPSWAHSLDAEQSVLGALLLGASHDTYDTVAEIISASDFVGDDHRSIFGAIAALRRQQIGCDVITVSDWIARDGAEKLKAIGGMSYLGQLAASSYGSSNIVRYAEIVRDKAHARRLDKYAQDISSAARGLGNKGVMHLYSEAKIRLAALEAGAARLQRLHSKTASGLLNLALPDLKPLLTPWLFEKNLVMVHAKRGVGKTHFALASAFAVAAGSTFLGWRAPQPRKVLYIDGEMPVQSLQQRVRDLASSHGEIPDALRIITPDLQEKAMPDLATTSGQADIDAHIDQDTALIVVDNISCLVRSGGAENESESWTFVSEWALKHRRAGRAVMFIHHSGKTGAQRGTSKREDLLDVVIGLRRPTEYGESDGAVFEVHFEKARSLTGDDIVPIEAKLEQGPSGGQQWTTRAVSNATRDQVIALWETPGMNLTDVAREVGLHKSNVSRTLTKAMREGLLKRTYPSQRGKPQ